MEKLKIKIVREGADVPVRATDGSAGYDLKACITEDLLLLPGETKMIPTGIAIQLASNQYVGLLFSRSSIAVKYGQIQPNAVGVIDSDYRGEIMVALKNMSTEGYTIHKGDRIAQLVIVPVSLPEVEVCDELEESARGTGGFGSTGR